MLMLLTIPYQRWDSETMDFRQTFQKRVMRGGGGCFSVNYVFSYALIQVTEPPSSYTRYFAVQLIVMFSFESACDEVIMTKYGDLASGCQDCIRSLGGSIPYSLFQFMAFLTYFWLALLPFAS